MEIACEEIPGSGSYKDKPQIVEGPQCIIYQLHGSKFEQTPGTDDYEDVKEKKEGITIVQFEYYLILKFIWNKLILKNNSCKTVLLTINL